MFILFCRDGDGIITNTGHTDSGVAFVETFRGLEDVERAIANKTGLGSTNSVVSWSCFQVKMVCSSFTATEWDKEEPVHSNGSCSIFNTQEEAQACIKTGCRMSHWWLAAVTVIEIKSLKSSLSNDSDPIFWQIIQLKMFSFLRPDCLLSSVNVWCFTDCVCRMSCPQATLLFFSVE